jgi:hypothetical protein
MRITVNLDDKLHRELKSLAREEGVTLGEIFERVVTIGHRLLHQDSENAGSFAQEGRSRMEESQA